MEQFIEWVKTQTRNGLPRPIAPHANGSVWVKTYWSRRDPDDEQRIYSKAKEYGLDAVSENGGLRITPMTKTPHDVELLKANWTADPCWDIEETEGFEAHREELAAFRQEMEVAWALRDRQALLAKATQVGIGDNLKLAGYLAGLEAQIDRLTRAVEEQNDQLANAYALIGRLAVAVDKMHGGI